MSAYPGLVEPCAMGARTIRDIRCPAGHRGIAVEVLALLEESLRNKMEFRLVPMLGGSKRIWQEGLYFTFFYYEREANSYTENVDEEIYYILTLLIILPSE